MRTGRSGALREWLRAAAHVGVHVGVIAFSAAVALSLPWIVRSLATNLLTYWSLVENERAFLVSIELMVAVVVIVLLNYGGRAWRNRRAARIVAIAGLTSCVRPARAGPRRRVRRLKERQGFGRDVMIVGCTGFRTFVEPTAELHQVLRHCRTGRILLLNPWGAGARARARSLLLPDVTPERFAAQIRASVDFLKALRAGDRNVRLKLYDEAPLLKLTILGEHIWVRHYHPGRSADGLPEYVFEDSRSPGGLYGAFYQYFVTRWEDPITPELDLETEELVYRDAAGNELRRQAFARPAPESVRGSVPLEAGGWQMLPGKTYTAEGER